MAISTDPSWEDLMRPLAERAYEQRAESFQRALGIGLGQQCQQKEQKAMTGSKPIVVCNGQHQEAKDLGDAQAIAERLAHQHQADAYILKPVKKVAPKRDVVTTDLE